MTRGKADFIALGRPLIADPEWVDKLRRGEPARRCLACNTCVNEMRGGAKLGCVVNAAVGRERAFRSAAPAEGERIAVVGAGPAGLTYASLAAGHNAVTVFERGDVPGGAFRLAGKAPLFQEVEADERVMRDVRIADQRTDREAAVRRRFDFVERQALDIDEILRLLDVELHQVDQRCPAGDEANVRALLRGFCFSRGGDRLRVVVRPGELERLHPAFAPCRTF